MKWPISFTVCAKPVVRGSKTCFRMGLDRRAANSMEARCLASVRLVPSGKMRIHCLLPAAHSRRRHALALGASVAQFRLRGMQSCIQSSHPKIGIARRPRFAKPAKAPSIPLRQAMLPMARKSTSDRWFAMIKAASPGGRSSPYKHRWTPAWGSNRWTSKGHHRADRYRFAR